MTNSAEPIIIIDEEDKHHILGYFQHGYTKILHEIMNTNLELIYSSLPNNRGLPNKSVEWYKFFSLLHKNARI